VGEGPPGTNTNDGKNQTPGKRNESHWSNPPPTPLDTTRRFLFGGYKLYWISKLTNRNTFGSAGWFLEFCSGYRGELPQKKHHAGFPTRHDLPLESMFRTSVSNPRISESPTFSGRPGLDPYGMEERAHPRMGWKKNSTKRTSREAPGLPLATHKIWFGKQACLLGRTLLKRLKSRGQIPRSRCKPML